MLLSSFSQNVSTMLSNTNTTRLFSFPHLQTMRLCDRIETKLIGQTNTIANSLKLAVHEMPYTEVIRMCKSMIFDNEVMMQDVLGIKLTDDIKNVKL